MRIAIDYDDTYTLNPKMWDQAINLFMLNGFSVIMVTARRDTEENREELEKASQGRWRCYFTNLGSKTDFIRRRGMKVDVWIDDDPESLVHGR